MHLSALPSENNSVLTSAETRSLSAFYLQPSVAVKLIGLAAKFSTPVRYMIWPPDIPEWQELVEEDEYGVKRPKKSLEVENRVGAVSWAGLWWLFVAGCEAGSLMI